MEAQSFWKVKVLTYWFTETEVLHETTMWKVHTGFTCHHGKANDITRRHQNGAKHKLTSTDSNLGAFTCNPADGSQLSFSFNSINQLSE